jgi:predicted nucleic acid-binding protein
VTAFVVDASAILAWCFEDEWPKQRAELMDRLVEGGMAAPSHWPLEITNILWEGERRRRISAAHAADFIQTVEDLGAKIDPETSKRAWRDVYVLARDDKLTTYDAAYLELAMRIKATLVSRDAALVRAAKRRGVPTIVP